MPISVTELNSSAHRLQQRAASNAFWQRRKTAGYMRILVIEDSRMLRLAIERLLSKAGYEVTSVGDGQQGLDLAQSINPDLIVLDLMLPTLEGTEVLRQLRKFPGTMLIPVIVLSGLSQKNESKLKTAGATAFVEKSKLNLETNGAVLLQLVGELFSSRPRASTAHGSI
jgi:CheY-like chemotaxis protein